MRNNLITFEPSDKGTNVQVILDGDTVWLSQAQMVELFSRERSVITKHIRKIISDGELDNSVCAFFAHTASDGKTYQVEHYNLDMIISARFMASAPSRPDRYGGTGFTSGRGGCQCEETK